MSDKIAFNGTPGSETFALAGSRIIWAPVNTSKPPLITPIYNDSIPAGWADLGIPVQALVEMTVDFTTAKVVTGVLQNVRRTYIDSQTGKITAKIFDPGPTNTAIITGQGPLISTASTSLNRAFKGMGVGGTLGAKLALLVYKDFDISQVTSDGSASYEQVWHYTPTAQRNASVNLAEHETKTPIHTLDYELLPYTNSSYSGRSILIEVVWLSV
jgi:hypothetical protein